MAFDFTIALNGIRSIASINSKSDLELTAALASLSIRASESELFSFQRYPSS